MSYVWRSSVTLWKLVQTHYEHVRYEMGTVTLEGGGCQCEILNLLAGVGWGGGGVGGQLLQSPGNLCPGSRGLLV